MAEIKKAVKEKVVKEKIVKERTVLFTRDNYIWMAIGGVIIIIGMFLMSGGKSQDPNVFDKEVVYSSTRLTVAPLVILLGFVVEIYAIFRKPAVSK